MSSGGSKEGESGSDSTSFRGGGSCCYGGQHQKKEKCDVLEPSKDVYELYLLPYKSKVCEEAKCLRPKSPTVPQTITRVRTEGVRRGCGD